MVNENTTVKRKVISEITYWTVATMIATMLGFMVLGAFTILSSVHHDKDIDRLDARIDLECIKKP